MRRCKATGASLVLGVACSEDEDDGGGNNGGTGGKGGSSGSTTGGSSGKGGTNTGGSSTGGSNTGGSAGKGGTNTGGSSTGGSTTGGTSGAAGGDDGGMGGADGGMGGGGGEGGEGVVFDTLLNADFEANSLDFWEETGDVDASYNVWDGGRNATRRLAHYRAYSTAQPEFDVSTFQTISPIANGTYTFSLWVTRHTDFLHSYIFARGHNAAMPTEEIQVLTPGNDTAYEQISIPNIVVTSGQVTIGIRSHGYGNRWANIDDATLTKNP